MGNLSEKDKGRSNILESEAEIVEGFVEALRASGSGEGTQGELQSQGEVMIQRGTCDCG